MNHFVWIILSLVFSKEINPLRKHIQSATMNELKSTCNGMLVGSCVVAHLAENSNRLVLVFHCINRFEDKPSMEMSVWKESNHWRLNNVETKILYLLSPLRQHKWFIFVYCPFHLQHGSCFMDSNNIIAVCHPFHSITYLYELKTLKHSHQTFNMISFKPIMAINLWMVRPIASEPPQKGLHYALIPFSLFRLFIFLIKNTKVFDVVNLDRKDRKTNSIEIYFVKWESRLDEQTLPNYIC